MIFLSVTEPAVNAISTNKPGSQHLSILNLKEETPEKSPPPPPPDPTLDELRKLSRDLTAVRLQMDKYFQGSRASQEWQMIGIVIDRLLFGLYIVFILASFVTIMGIWIWNNTYSA